MAHESALIVVNQIQDQMSALARKIADALADGKISPWEGIGLGMQGMQFASFVMTAFQTVDKATQKDILYVLENMDIVLPEGK